MNDSRKNSWEKIWKKKGPFEKIIDLGRSVYSYFYSRVILKYSNPGTEVAELGCGTATTAILLSKKIKKYTGLDYSQAAVDLASENLKNAGVENSEIIQMDALNIPLEQMNRFDLVWSAGLIEHFPDYAQIIRSHYDLAKPNGGIILLAVPYQYSYHYLWYLLTRNRYLNRFWPWENTDMKLLRKKELLEAGLKVSPNAKVRFLSPSAIGFILGIIVLEIKR